MKIKIINTPLTKTGSKGNYYSVTITDDTGKEKQGNLFINDKNAIPMVDSEYEVTETYSEQYKAFTWFQVKDKQQGQGKFPVKDWTYEKRKASLDNALSLCEHIENFKTGDILKIAEEFYKYLNQK